jgi:hypothetical protein
MDTCAVCPQSIHLLPIEESSAYVENKNFECYAIERIEKSHVVISKSLVEVNPNAGIKETVPIKFERMLVVVP